MSSKNYDTLYFIEQSIEGNVSSYNLYLGDKLITNSLENLKDLSLKGLSANDLLVYDSKNQVWKNINLDSFIKLLNIPSISVFTGASGSTELEEAKPGTSGLVPAPIIGQHNYFLKGDGTWSDIQPIISKEVNSGIATIVNGAPETFDTLKEISDWIGNNESGATMMINKISTIESSVGNLNSLLTENKNTVVDAINELADRFTWEEIQAE